MWKRPARWRVSPEEPIIPLVCDASPPSPRPRRPPPPPPRPRGAGGPPRLLRGIVREGGMRVVANRAGSHLMRRIAAAMAEAAGLDGGFAGAARRLGVFEVDEATVPEADPALAAPP